VGENLFQVVSFSLVWSADAAWGLLRSAQLHNHLCPGVNAGYVLARYVQQHFPLEPSENYTFLAAPPACPVDGVPAVLDATAGKRCMYAVQVSEQSLSERFGDLRPTLIVMRSNPEADTCRGTVLGFDYEENCKKLGMEYSDFSPLGGKSNPLFFISRAKAAWKMAAAPMEQKLDCVRVLRRFSGNDDLVGEIVSAGTDPYAVIEAHKKEQSR
jgi:hypothetical protein